MNTIIILAIKKLEEHRFVQTKPGTWTWSAMTMTFRPGDQSFFGCWSSTAGKYCVFFDFGDEDHAYDQLVQMVSWIHGYQARYFEFQHSKTDTRNRADQLRSALADAF